MSGIRAFLAALILVNLALPAFAQNSRQELRRTRRQVETETKDIMARQKNANKAMLERMEKRVQNFPNQTLSATSGASPLDKLPKNVDEAIEYLKKYDEVVRKKIRESSDPDEKEKLKLSRVLIHIKFTQFLAQKQFTDPQKRARLRLMLLNSENLPNPISTSEKAKNLIAEERKRLQEYIQNQKAYPSSRTSLEAAFQCPGDCFQRSANFHLGTLAQTILQIKDLAD